MDQWNEYYHQAELSLAAYALLSTGEPNRSSLIEAGMSAAQADRFATTYTVVAQFTDPTTGLSATVFENTVTHSKHLAIRGTNDGLDLLTDYLDIKKWPRSFEQ